MLGILAPAATFHGIPKLNKTQQVRVGLATGMRLGEVMGLCWRSVDLNQPCIHAVQQRSAYGEINPPKGRCKKRTVFIDAGHRHAS